MRPQGEEEVNEGVAPPVWRRFFHLAAGSLVPLAGIFAPIPEFLAVLAALVAGGLALDLIRFRVSWLNRVFLRWLRPLLKVSEDRQVTGATYLLVAAFFAFLLFDRPVAVAVMLFLAVGDPVAALVGRPMPGPRLFGKSPIGTLAFVAVSLLVVAGLGGVGVITYHWSFLVGAVVAGLVELLPLPLDDNLTVPLIAGSVMQYLEPLLAFVGFL